MRHARPIPFTWPDALAVIVVAAFAAGAASLADRERTATFEWSATRGWTSKPSATRNWKTASWWPEPNRGSLDHRDWSRWPYWLQEQRLPAFRVVDDARIALAVASLGLGMLAFRPRRGASRGRSAPGHLASAVAAILVVLGLLEVVRMTWLDPLLHSWLGKLPLGGPRNDLPWWYSFTSGLPIQAVGWVIAVAWITLATLGWRGGPIDGHDRLGRRLGWAWIAVTILNWFFRLVPLS